METGSGAIGRSHIKLPETVFQRARLVGHQGLWPPNASLGTGKDLAGLAGRKVGWCFCQGASQTLTQFHLGGPDVPSSELEAQAGGSWKGQ